MSSDGPIGIVVGLLFDRYFVIDLKHLRVMEEMFALAV